MTDRLRKDVHTAAQSGGFVVRHGDEETLEIDDALEAHSSDLKKRGLMIPSGESDWRWALFGAPPKNAIRLTGAPSEIRDGFLEMALLGDDAGFEVLIETGVDLPARRAMNASAWEKKRPWMLAQLCGPTLLRWFVFVPGETACAECLEIRLLANRRNPEGYAAIRDAQGGRMPSVPSPALLRVAAGMLAIEAGRAVAGCAVASAGNLYEFDLAGMTLSREKLLPVPACGVCA